MEQFRYEKDKIVYDSKLCNFTCLHIFIEKHVISRNWIHKHDTKGIILLRNALLSMETPKFGVFQSHLMNNLGKHSLITRNFHNLLGNVHEPSLRSSLLFLMI